MSEAGAGARGPRPRGRVAVVLLLTVLLGSATGAAYVLTHPSRSAQPAAATSSSSPRGRNTAGPTAGDTSESAPSSPAFPQLTMSNLPTAKDLEWDGPGDWRTRDSLRGPGQDSASACLWASPSTLDGVQRIFRRDFGYQRPRKGQAAVVIMEFDSVDDTASAVATLQSWASRCDVPLRNLDFVTVKPASDFYRVRGSGSAEFLEISYVARDAPAGSGIDDEAFGIAAAGNRVALVSMVTTMSRQWSHDQNNATSSSLHPMFRTLPKVLQRLTQ